MHTSSVNCCEKHYTSSVNCCEKPYTSLHQMIHFYHNNHDSSVLNICIILSLSIYPLRAVNLTKNIIILLFLCGWPELEIDEVQRSW